MDTSTTATATRHHAGSDGVFVEYEKILVPMSTGTACAFYLAHTPEGFHYGFEFFIRSPKNHVKKLPAMIDGVAGKLDQKKRLLLWLIDGHASKFFSDHKAAVKKVAEFRALVAAEAELPSGHAAPVEFAAEPEPAVVEIASQVETLATGPAAEVPAAEPLPTDGQLQAVVENPPSAADGAAAAAELAFRQKFRAEAAGMSSPAQRGRYAEIAVAEIERGDNPRKTRSAEKFAELVESMRAKGELLQPIAVRDLGEGRWPARYQLIFGEGRWLGAQELGWPLIEAKVYTGLDAAAALEMALIENLQREDMNAMDEAEGFAELSHLGRSPAEMAERTGKDLSTIKRSLALVKLPDEVRGMVRTGALSARQARNLVRWVSPKGAPGSTAADFVARPLVCQGIAKAAAEFGISSDDLAEGIPEHAIAELVFLEAITEVPGKYYDRICALELFAHTPETGKYFRLGSEARFLFCFADTDWKTLKKQIDAELREATKQAARKASTKVESKVSVPVADLEKSKTKFVELSPEDEKRYADHLPKGSCTLGVAKSGAEVMLCIKPEHLAQLKEAEAKALAEDRKEKILDADRAAQAKLKKLKRITSREMAFVIEAAGNGFNASIDEPGNEHVWKAAGLKYPKGKKDTRHLLESFEPVDQFRLFIHAILGDAHMDDPDLVELLCWILEVPNLGMITDNPKAWSELISQLAADLWPAESPTPFDEPVEKPSAAKKPKAKKTKKKTRR